MSGGLSKQREFAKQKREQNPFMALLDPEYERGISRLHPKNVLPLAKLYVLAEKYPNTRLKEFLSAYLGLSQSINGLRGQEIVQAIRGPDNSTKYLTPVNLASESKGGPDGTTR